MVYDGSDGTSDNMPCLRFGLSKPADLIVPSDTSLVPKKPKLDGATLDSLKLLAQETQLSIYMAHGDLMLDTLLQSLCAAVADKSLKPLDMSLEVLGINLGRGFRILQGEELRLAPSLPSYDVPEEPPAPYSPKSGKSGLTLLICILLI